MTSEARSHEKSLAANLLSGLLGAGLIYYGRRNKGILAAIGTTAGYSLLTKAVSGTILAALESSGRSSHD